MNFPSNNPQREHAITKFVVSAAAILIISGVAKMVSAGGSDRYLQANDPLLGIQFRSLFIIAGSVEIATALFCFFGKHLASKLMCIGCLSVNFMLYRIGLLMIGYKRPCYCLGNLTTAIHVSPYVADIVMRCALGYMMLGSSLALYWVWSQRTKLC
jgi:hypothetical protein